MRQTKHIRFLFAIALLVAIVPFSAFAQSSNGSISGSVTDASAGALPGVTITALNSGTGITRTSVSNSAGHYEIQLLPPGTYSVSSELSGFAPVKYGKIVVNVGTDSTVSFSMKQGVSESVTVTASAPLVDTTRSEVSSVVNEKAIENLPTNGRNFIDFVLTTPGVVRDVRLALHRPPVHELRAHHRVPVERELAIQRADAQLHTRATCRHSLAQAPPVRSRTRT